MLPPLLGRRAPPGSFPGDRQPVRKIAPTVYLGQHVVWRSFPVATGRSFLECCFRPLWGLFGWIMCAIMCGIMRVHSFDDVGVHALSWHYRNE